MIDNGEADDKIIAILKQDEIYNSWKDVSELPESLLKRLKHYFLTYKDMPGKEQNTCEITHTYGKEEALEIIKMSQLDYIDHFGNINTKLSVAAMDAIERGQVIKTEVKKIKTSDRSLQLQIPASERYHKWITVQINLRQHKRKVRIYP